MYGLNKKRTKLGTYLDRNKITQEQVRTAAGLQRELMAKVCNDAEHHPQEKTMIRIVSALRKMGYDVRMSDFW